MRPVDAAQAGGVGMATGVIGTPAAVIGLGFGWALGADPLFNGSVALLTRSLVWHLYHGPCAEVCPAGSTWDHLANKCVVAKAWLV